MASKDIKAQRIAFIIDLQKKEPDNAKIIKYCAKRFHISERQVHNYLKEIEIGPIATLPPNDRVAHVQFPVRSKPIEISGLMSYAEKRQILAAIARGEVMTYRVIGTKEVIDEKGNIMTEPLLAAIPPSIRDRIFAIIQDNEMTGDTAPDKHLTLNQELPFIFDVITPAKPEHPLDGETAGGI